MSVEGRVSTAQIPKRQVVEAVLYRLREGCRWRALPYGSPPWDTVYDHQRRWQRHGVWPQAVAVLGTRWREVALGRARRTPRHAILDSQAVKTAAEGKERGLDGGKKVKGRSRHVAADRQGPLLAVHVCAASTPCVRESLTKIKASPAGTAIANTLGPVRGISSGGEAQKTEHAAVAFILEPADEKMAAALVQQ